MVPVFHGSWHQVSKPTCSYVFDTWTYTPILTSEVLLAPYGLQPIYLYLQLPWRKIFFSFFSLFSFPPEMPQVAQSSTTLHAHFWIYFGFMGMLPTGMGKFFMLSTVSNNIYYFSVILNKLIIWAARKALLAAFQISQTYTFFLWPNCQDTAVQVQW